MSRNCCYVWDPIYAGETHNVLQLIRSLYPTNLLLSFRNTLSLQRHFLTPTLSFIDRGCYLEKQKKKRRRTDRKGGRGRQGKKNKSLARKAYEITEGPLIKLVAPDCFSANANIAIEIDFISLFENLKLLPTVTMTRAWKGAFPGIDTKKSSDVRVNIMSKKRVVVTTVGFINTLLTWKRQRWTILLIVAKSVQTVKAQRFVWNCACGRLQTSEVAFVGWSRGIFWSCMQSLWAKNSQSL